MKVCGYGIREHVRLLAPLFGLIAAVWALRLVLDAAGAPRGLVRIFSVTVFGAVAVLLAVLLIHFRGFGSYPNVAVAALLLVFWQQLLIVAAIAFSTLTGTKNIFAAPEYSGPGLTPGRHILGHLIFGIGMGELMGAAMGCLFLWLLRKILPMSSRSQNTA